MPFCACCYSRPSPYMRMAVLCAGLRLRRVNVKCVLVPGCPWALPCTCSHFASRAACVTSGQLPLLPGYSIFSLASVLGSERCGHLMGLSAKCRSIPLTVAMIASRIRVPITHECCWGSNFIEFRGTASCQPRFSCLPFKDSIT